MREWLTVIIVVLIIVILVDGFRRMRAHRRETVRLSKNMMEVDALLHDDHLSGSEFPRGGARVAGYREATDAENIHQNVKDSYAASKVTRGAPKRQPEQVALNLDTPVPMLMESINSKDIHSDASDDELGFSRETEPSLGNLDELDEAPSVEAQQHSNKPWYEDYEEPEEELDTYQQAQPEAYDNTYEEQEFEEATPEQESVVSDVRHTAPEPEFGEDEISKPRVVERKPAAAKPERDLPDEVLVINVMAKRGEVFLGEPLLQALIDNGLRYGDMDIFHRYETVDGKGKTLFSVANMLKPGTFDLEAMESFETPGITMFLTLPTGSDSLQAYDLMAETAVNIVSTMGGELKDENRSVMTRQTIEHGRQRVVEYERKRRLAKA